MKFNVIFFDVLQNLFLCFTLTNLMFCINMMIHKVFASPTFAHNIRMLNVLHVTLLFLPEAHNTSSNKIVCNFFLYCEIYKRYYSWYFKISKFL